MVERHPSLEGSNSKSQAVPGGIGIVAAAGKGRNQCLCQAAGIDHAGCMVVICAIEQQYASRLGSPALGKIFRLLLKQGENECLNSVDAWIRRAPLHLLAR